MKKYYEALGKIGELNNFDREKLLPYIWRQKEEISATLNIHPRFWVLLDYAIHLTESLLKAPKERAEKNIQHILRPIFEKYNSQIRKIYSKIPKEEFAYVREEMKAFHHIVTHTINLIDKRLPHFIPSYLFISSVEHMQVLYPMDHRTIDPLLLLRGHYTTLVARYLSARFSPALVKLMDYLAWYEEIKPILLGEDRIKVRKTLIQKFDAVLKEERSEDAAHHNSIEQMVVELREIVSFSLIAQKIMELKDEVEKWPEKDQLNCRHILSEIASIFLPTSAETQLDNTRARDLTIAVMVLNQILISMQAKDTAKLSDTLVLAGNILPFLKNVTAHIVSPQAALHIGMLEEIVDYLSFHITEVIPEELEQVIRDTISPLQQELQSAENKDNVTVTADDIHLFLEKAGKLRAEGELSV